MTQRFSIVVLIVVCVLFALGVAMPGAAMPMVQPPYSEELFSNATFDDDVSGWGYSEGDCQEPPFWLVSHLTYTGLLHTSEDCATVYIVIDQTGVIPPEYNGQTFYVEARGWMPCANVTMDFYYPGGFLTDSQASGTGILVLNGSDTFDLSGGNEYSIWLSLDQGCGYDESWFDYISLTADAGSTPTPTITPTATATPTLTPTVTATPTITPTVTVTPTATLGPTGVTIYTIDLPSGGQGELYMSATAGDVLVTIGTIGLGGVTLFYVLYRMAFHASRR